LASELSKSLAISCSDGNPPAVTSDANVKVQYDSLLLAGAMVKVNWCNNKWVAQLLDFHAIQRDEPVFTDKGQTYT
jgi:hypothetical protein